MHASHLMIRLPSTAIGGKTLLDIWLSVTTQDYSLLRVFECPIYFGVKDDKLNPQTKSLYFGVSKEI